jgi:hypothetical protein
MPQDAIQESGTKRGLGLIEMTGLSPLTYYTLVLYLTLFLTMS